MSLRALSSAQHQQRVRAGRASALARKRNPRKLGPDPLRTVRLHREMANLAQGRYASGRARKSRYPTNRRSLPVPS